MWLDWPEQNALTLASIFVAACALGLTIWQGVEQRIHNRKSVLPIVNVVIESAPSATGNEAGVYLRNTGIGPADITGIGVFYKGKPLIDASELRGLLDSRWPPGSERPGKRLWRVWKIPFNNKIESAILSVGEQQYLIALCNDSWTPEFVQALSDILQDIVVHMRWKSVYGKGFEDYWTS